MSVLENVMVGLEADYRMGLFETLLQTKEMKAKSKAIEERALVCLTFFGPRLMDWRYEPASSLSYANRRRLEIARAIAAHPKLLLLDEPTAGMNPQETAELAEQIRQFQDTGITIFVIEHDMKILSWMFVIELLCSIMER